MANIYGNKRNIDFNNVSGYPDYNYFGVVHPDNYVDWVYCREDLQRYFLRRKPINNKRFKLLYCHSNGRGIMHLIHDVEEIMSLPQRSLFGPTQRDYITWIDISPWWFKGYILKNCNCVGGVQRCSAAMKKSFFTMMIRAGVHYNCSGEMVDIEEAFESTPYYGNYFAIRRFLGGNTAYKGRRTGWLTQFRYVDNKRIESLLVKP